MRKLVWTTLVIASVCACRGEPTKASSRPASITDEHVRLFERMVTALTTLGPKLDAGGEDCNKLVAMLKEAANPSLVAEMSNAPDLTDDPAAREWFMKKYAGRVDPAMASLSRVTRLCSSHPELESSVTAIGFRKRAERKPEP